MKKEFVLLRCAISLKFNYEKVKFSNCVFCDNFSDYIWTMDIHVNYLKNIINDVQNKGNGEINTA